MHSGLWPLRGGSVLSAMTCRPATCVPARRDRERDPQHPVSSPKIHRRSPIHSSLPSHLGRSNVRGYLDGRIIDGGLPGRAGLDAGGRYVHSGESRTTRTSDGTRSNDLVDGRRVSLCPRATTRRALFFSVGKAGKNCDRRRRRRRRRALAYTSRRAGKTPAEIIFYHLSPPPRRTRERTFLRFITEIYIYFKLVASFSVASRATHGIRHTRTHCTHFSVVYSKLETARERARATTVSKSLRKRDARLRAYFFLGETTTTGDFDLTGKSFRTVTREI